MSGEPSRFRGFEVEGLLRDIQRENRRMLEYLDSVADVQENVKIGSTATATTQSQSIRTVVEGPRAYHLEHWLPTKSRKMHEQYRPAPKLWPCSLKTCNNSEEALGHRFGVNISADTKKMQAARGNHNVIWPRQHM